MPAPRHVIQLTANRSVVPLPATDLWQGVPLALSVSLAAGVSLDGAASLIFEVHSKSTGGLSVLLAQTRLDDLGELVAPYSLELTGAQMQILVASSRTPRQLEGVLYALYLIDDEDNPTELDILAKLDLTLHRAGATPLLTPSEPLDAWLTRAAADQLYAAAGQAVDTLTRLISTTLAQGDTSLSVTLRPGEAILCASVQASAGVFFVDCDSTGRATFSMVAPEDLSVLVMVQKAPVSAGGLRIVDATLVNGASQLTVELASNEAVITASIQQADVGIFFLSGNSGGLVQFSDVASSNLPVKVVINSPLPL